MLHPTAYSLPFASSVRLALSAVSRESFVCNDRNHMGRTNSYNSVGTIRVRSRLARSRE